MDELPDREQYFFDHDTLEHLAPFVARYQNPCCLCTPLLGQHLVERKVPVTILDVDERFSDLCGYKPYDVYRPEWLEEEFDLIVCDPPFFKVSLSQLFPAIRMLAHHDYRQRLLMCYLTRRSAALLRAFAKFGLEATGYRPGYQTVRPTEKNEIECYGNLGEEEHQRLRGIASG